MGEHGQSGYPGERTPACENTAVLEVLVLHNAFLHMILQVILEVKYLILNSSAHHRAPPTHQNTQDGTL